MKFMKYLFLLILLNSSVLSKTIDISKISKKIDLLPKSYLYIDNNIKEQNFEKIKKQSFKKNDKTIINFGINKNKAVWIKFTLENKSLLDKRVILEYVSSITRKIELYENDAVYIDGLSQINKNRHSLKPSFIINLTPNKKQVYYIKAQSNGASLSTKLNLWEEEKFTKHFIYQNNITSLFFGAIFILFVYNLFIYIFTKDKVYLYYIFYIAFVSLHLSIYVGYASLYLFDQNQIDFVMEQKFLIVSLVMYFIVEFTVSLLNLKRFKKFHSFIYVCSIMLIFFSLINFNLLILFFIPIVLLLYKASYLAFVKKEDISYIYLIAWFPIFFIFVGWIYFSTSKNIFNEAYEIFPYILQFVHLFEAITFSIALAYRIKLLQQTKEKLNTQLIYEQQNREINLHEQVKDKTKHLNLALEEKVLLMQELHHRVKNNLQMVNSLLRLQSLEIVNDETKEIFTQAQNRIKAISFLHELLYKQHNITSISTKEYFIKLIDEMIKTYGTKAIIRTNITCDIKLENIIYCGLILNELVLNSIKYAFSNVENSHAQIDIILKKQNKLCMFIIKDNGVGFTQSKQNKTLGLTLVNTLVKNQLKGDIIIKSEKGTHIEMSWLENG